MMPTVLNSKLLHLKLLVITILFTKFAHFQNLMEEFRVSPHDAIYLNRSSKSHRFFDACVPPVGEPEATVEWRKGNNILKNNDRVHVHASAHVHKPGDKSRLKTGTVIYLLEIKPVLPSDQGTYSCVASNKHFQRENKFQIVFMNKCNSSFFECKKEAICIFRAALCNGIANCHDKSDELLIHAGCLVPAPSNLRAATKSRHGIKMTWDKIPKAYRYEVRIIYPNNEKKTIIAVAEKRNVTFDGLQPGTIYVFRIRAKTLLSNFSDFSWPVQVKTPVHERLAIPCKFHGTVINGVGIIVRWGNIVGAERYEIVITYPDRANKTVVAYPELTEIILKNVLKNATYSFRMRQWSGFQFGNYTKTLHVETRSNEASYTPIKITGYVNGNITMFWNDSRYASPGDVSGSNSYELTYAIKYCKLKRYLRKWRTYGKTKVLNKTVHFVTNHQAMSYRKVFCKNAEPFANHINKNFTGLIDRSIYWYRINVYTNGRILGQLLEGNFTVKMVKDVEPTPPPPEEPESPFTGVVIYAISSGILIVVLIFAFILAYFCKWEKLMNDIRLKKARMAAEAQQAEYDKIKLTNHQVSRRELENLRSQYETPSSTCNNYYT